MIFVPSDLCNCSQKRDTKRDPLSEMMVSGTPCKRTIPAMTEPPKIIPYYRLSLSTWPLSNNKELLCRFYRVKPDESLTTGSRYALSPHEGGTRVQHYITIYKRFTSSTLLQSRFSYIKVTHGSQFRQRKVNYTHDTHRRPSMHITPHHCSPIQVPKHMG
jgi:hypothetical protein